MKRFFTLAATLVCMGAMFATDSPPPEAPAKPAKHASVSVKAGEMPTYLQDISVTIHAEESQGSGCVIIRGDTAYVLTAGHVVAGLRTTRTVIDPKTGTPRIKIEFDPAKVVKEIYQDGRSVGRLDLDAEVVRYSDADNGEDLALLRLRKKDFLKSSAVFNCDPAPVPVGTKLLHCGSLLGQMGSNSLTSGIVSQVGRVRHEMVYDQSTCAAFPGSSGGGIYREADGKYIGMIVRGAGETFNLYVPIRRIQTWAKRVNVQFVLDEALPVPSNDELFKTPVEEVGGELPGFSAQKAPRPQQPHSADGDTELPFLIYRR